MQKIVRYLNLYDTDTEFGRATILDAHRGLSHDLSYPSRAEADLHSLEPAYKRIACVRVEITEGQFDN